MLNEKRYIDLMVPFYNFARQEIRKVDEKLSYYGTGEAGHWAIQSNFNVAGALAVLAETKEDIPLDKNELREMALRLFRYNLAAHQTGNGKASCGNKWGCSWISILGLERMVAGQLALEPYFTDADREAFRKLRLAEADFLLTYDIVAGMCADDSGNKPESNYWNGSFLYRAYIDYPDAPNREAYLEKSCAFLLNAISHPLDAASIDPYLGRELRNWHIGFNFTPNYSLDHHAYMNVGYSVITLSHAAYLYFYCKARKQEFPDFARLHVHDLWKVVKNFIFPDGRLLRLGGDSRARYCYCQMYLLPILMMMKDQGDQDALQFENGMLATIRHEQLDNPDGSFFGTRLADMKVISRYYYTRLESDPFAALAFCADFRRRFGDDEEPQTVSASPAEWEDAFHAANIVRSDKVVRSMVRRGAEGPVALALPLDDSSLAEWCGNGHAQLLGRASIYHETSKFNRSFPGGFINSGDTEISERLPVGEGEGIYVIANSSAACAALPDGKSMIILEKAHVVKEHMLFSLRSIGWKIPNDVHNDKKRSFYWNGSRRELKSYSGDGVIDTASTHVNVDDKISLVLGYGADSLKIYAPEQAMGVIKTCRSMTSLYVNEICGNVEELPARRRMPGDVLADTGYAVIAGVSAADGEGYKLRRLDAPGELRAVEFSTPEGKVWRFAANFGTLPENFDGRDILPGQCDLY
ncbi:MAG: hypothetical protein IJY46_09000 [Lentisphaeria bacterium]|nr:hypothetical protein [Lentisphaeria bacterium]